MPNNLFKELETTLNNARDIAIIIHQKADGDALGSALALAEYFKKNNLNYTLFQAGKKSDYLSFVNDYKDFINDEKIFQNKKFSHLVFLDCGELRQSGLEKILPQLKYSYTSINIDHHISNPSFAKLNFIFPQASSTSEILYDFFEKIRCPINKTIAGHLLLGIYSDTQTLTNLATTPKTIKVVSGLLSRGAQIKPISKNLEMKRVATLKLWAKALQRITRVDKYKITYTIITQKDLEECKLDQEATGGIANFFNTVEEDGVNMILTEMADGSIKGSLRTTSAEQDVAKLAACFNGGGHKKAAGFRINGQLKQTNSGWKII